MAPAFMSDGRSTMDSADAQYAKGVKHLYETGIRKVPHEYVLPVSERPTSSPTTIPTTAKGYKSENNLKLPVIDFAQLHGPNRDQVLTSLINACENYGFFQLVNHGISDTVISNMIDVAKRFFEQPQVEREKYMSSDITNKVRYGTSFNQTQDGVLCWRDFLKLVCQPLADVLPLWPASPMDFRDMAETYIKETKFLFEILVDGILESLGLTTSRKKRTGDDEDEDEDEDEEEKIFLNELKHGSHLMVLNCYPPCPEPDLTLGMPPHSDYGFLSFVLQDEVEGLQIQHQGKWLTIEPNPGSFVVNVGDHLEIFSNGRYKSVLHRVVVNSLKSRISVASFHSIPLEGTVRPAQKIITRANPRRYIDTDFTAFISYLQSRDSKAKNFLDSRKVI